MANFRCERLFVKLDQPVPGLDHIKAIDPVDLAGLHTGDDALFLDLTPLEDFVFGPYDRPRWISAAVGLQTTRGLLALYEKLISRADTSRGSVEHLAKKVEVLKRLEAILEAADTHDRRFCLVAKDLS